MWMFITIRKETGALGSSLEVGKKEKDDDDDDNDKSLDKNEWESADVEKRIEERKKWN